MADDFTRGMVCAAAFVASAYDQPTIAVDILRTCGKINWRMIDKYDRNLLKQSGIVLGQFTQE